ncbi:T-cell-specific surface glycoprotein CD28 [Etheostoma spectabile]|uniref:Immunoglobulin subtype domain-containing protein n=1 Tax=Etheostoma spectabile TaxID=54343 RepID=A0A5J5DI80_9PERO|nr:T-cell-specific surface glycoprotein CD28-like [Etheostoma spectabile]KAA8593065.1 hypothetical protein FQN60_018520 [Etheostoma spectabile]
MRAGVLWMVMVCLSDGKVPQCSVGPTVTVSKLSKVSVSCPSAMASSEFKYQLFFNGSCIGQIRLELDHAEPLFSGQFKVTANNSGEYVCMTELIYPPPRRKYCHITEVMVAETQSFAVNDPVLVANQSSPAVASGCSPSIPEAVMWVGCGVLFLYGLSITCITIAIWRKMKRDEEDTNVYVNIRPGEVRKPCKV